MTPPEREGPPVRGGLRWTLFGRLSTTAANGALMLVAALWLMDETTFGRFATVVGAQLLASRAALAGLDQGVVRLFTAERSPDAVVRAALWITGGLGLLGLLAATGIATLGGVGQFSPGAVLAIALGAAGSAFFDLGCAVLLARVDFRRAGAWMALMPTLRALVTIGAALATPGDARGAFLAFPLVTLLGGLALLRQIVAWHGFRADVATVRRVFGYSWWIGLGDAAAVLSLQSGLFVLVGLGMDAEAGRYAFALQLVQGFFAVFVAFYQALLPKAARLPGPAALPGFLANAWRTSAALAGIAAVSALAIGLGLPMMLESLRPELSGFGAGFYGLTGFTMVLMLEAPLGVTCQYLLRPRLQVGALLVRCIAIGVLAALLVPAHGALGAGIAQAGGALGAAALLLFVVLGVVERTRDGASRACAAS